MPWPWLRRHGLSVHWADRWTEDLDRLLDALPESTECPHELLGALMRNPSRARKCSAVVTKNGVPVALIALRRSGLGRWDLIGGGGVCPRFLAHAVDGYLFPALSAIGVSVHVFTQAEPPPPEWAHQVIAHPVFRMSLPADMEAYWKKSGHLKTVKTARKRTLGFQFELDAPGAAEWTIRSWAAHWRGRASVYEDDLVLAAAYYERCGRFHTVRLLERGHPVSGSTWLVTGSGLLAITTFTKPEYREVQAGTRALDMTFEWAASAGFDEIDLGIGHDYKMRWAPPGGTRWSYDIRPRHLRAAAAIARGAARLARAALHMARRPPATLTFATGAELLDRPL